MVGLTMTEQQRSGATGLNMETKLPNATSSNHVAAKRPPTRSDSPPPQTHRRRHHHGGDGAASVAAALSKGIWVFTPVYEQGNEAEGERDNLDGAYK